MKTENEFSNIRFWRDWTLLSASIILASYMVSLIVVLLVHGAFGFTQMEGGTPLSQTLMQVAGGAVIGLGTGLYQRALLKKIFPVSPSWIYFLIAGFVITELAACLLLWQMGIERYKLRFIEMNPLPEALIFACAGLLTGILQWTLLRRHFGRSWCWIPASTLGWGIYILTTCLQFIPVMRSSVLFLIAIFALGAFLYGAVTGAALIWIKSGKRKDV